MIFVDTWAWMALANERDEAHGAAAEFLTAIRSSGQVVCTSDFVLGETITGLYRTLGAGAAEKAMTSILRSVHRGEVSLLRIAPERFNAAIALRRKFEDKPHISFTDLTSAAVMRELGITEVFSGDRHFGQIGFVLVPS